MPKARPKTHYEILGVAQDATYAEIDDAYERLVEMLNFESDCSGKPASKKKKSFIRRTVRLGLYTHAHAVLMNFEKRAQYDEELKVYDMPQYQTDLKAVRTWTHVVIALCAIMLASIIWQTVTNFATAGNVVVNVLGAVSWSAFWIGALWAVLLLIITGIIERRILRARWGKLVKTQAIRYLESHVDTLIIALLALILGLTPTFLAQMLKILF